MPRKKKIIGLPSTIVMGLFNKKAIKMLDRIDKSLCKAQDHLIAQADKVGIQSKREDKALAEIEKGRDLTFILQDLLIRELS